MKLLQTIFRCFQKKPIDTSTVITSSPNNGEQVVINGKLFSITYNTGDKVWFDDQKEVNAYLTHDGLFWTRDFGTYLDLYDYRSKLFKGCKLFNVDWIKVKQ